MASNKIIIELPNNRCSRSKFNYLYIPHNMCIYLCTCVCNVFCKHAHVAITLLQLVLQNNPWIGQEQIQQLFSIYRIVSSLHNSQCQTAKLTYCYKYERVTAASAWFLISSPPSFYWVSFPILSVRKSRLTINAELCGPQVVRRANAALA